MGSNNALASVQQSWHTGKEGQLDNNWKHEFPLVQNNKDRATVILLKQIDTRLVDALLNRHKRVPNEKHIMW